MRRLGEVTAMIAVIGYLPAAQLVEDLSSSSLTDLQRLRGDIEEELKGLAHASLNSGVGPIGFRSRPYDDPDNAEWVQIDLGEEGPVDEVVLVPALWRDTEEGFVSDAFPASFRIIAGVGEDDEGVVVANFPSTAHLLPRVAPIVVPVHGVPASWIRVEATKLNARAFDGRYIFQLSELLVLSGEENRALRRPVTPIFEETQLGSWSRPCLVDGILPYVMNAAEGGQSLAMVGMVDLDEEAFLNIDLGEVSSVSGLRLHAVDQSDTVPQAFSGDFGLPQRFRLEGANTPDFSDARVLLDESLTSIYLTGPVMAWRFEEASYRYFRIVVVEPYRGDIVILDRLRMGFAEIELLSGGKNVAENCAVISNLVPDSPERLVSSLTDGRNLYGEILPLRRWMVELARRHDLEVALPRVITELSARYDRQRARLSLVSWVAVILGAGIGLLLLYYRILRLRHENRIRERISANLHDELGANLHAIGLLGDLAKDVVDSREDLDDTLDRIRALTERTGSAARNCANMLGAGGVCDDLVAEMRRDSSRLLADLEHDIDIVGEDVLNKLSRRKRIDLYLFYKEALVNVIRHSGATRVETRVRAEAKEVCLSVADNGHGFTGGAPASLKRRARMLGAQFDVESPISGGTQVKLTLRKRLFRPLL